MLIDTGKSPFAKARPLPAEDFAWEKGFWKDRFDACADVTIPHVLSVFDDRDNFFHQVENFRIAAGLSEGGFRGTPFGDGDFYKLLEGMIYVNGKRRDPEAEARIDGYIALIARAQQPDGYLSTKQIIQEKLSGGPCRHGDVNDFEEYNFGHLFTCACAHKRVTGKDSLLRVAEGVAGYLERLYRKIVDEKRAWTAVCPSHYMGLAELYRTTGDPRYLEMLRTAIAIRDTVENGTDDNQDRQKLREHRSIVGHAVRATYLYAGAADLYLETGDETLLPALRSCWDNMVNKKLYITGGIGALYTGTSPFGLFTEAQRVHQAFGYEYQLPNVTAYNETCAALGAMFWALRMFAIAPEAPNFDLAERAGLNLALAAVSLDGDRYFYENALRRTKRLDYPLMWPLERANDFHCYCCPSNLARSISQMAGYAYMVSHDTVYLGIYGASRARFRLDCGARFTLVQETDYPWAGSFRYTFAEVESAAPFRLAIRVPGWAESGMITADGAGRAITGKDSGSYVFLDVLPDIHAEIRVELGMDARLTTASAMVEEDSGQACVERGPLVYCVEGVDAGLESLDELHLAAGAAYTPVEYAVAGKRIIALETRAARLVREGSPDALYRTLKVKEIRELPVRLIPYFAWDNRGSGEMRVWLPVLYPYGARDGS